jgi:AraC-like DNA-binding protein/ligand-binding sensor protein
LAFKNFGISDINVNEIIKLTEIYNITTGINSIAFSISEGILSNKGYGIRSGFCKFIQKYDKKSCKQSYVYSGLQSERHKEPYIYFCPYGLVNWTVPIVIKNQVKIFLTAGAILIHQVDDLLLENVFQQIPSLKSKSSEVRAKLKELKILDTVRVRYLSDLLLYLTKTFALENMLESRNEINTPYKLPNFDGLHNNQAQREGGKLYSFEKEKELISSIKLGDKERANQIITETLKFIYFHKNLELVKITAISLMAVSAQTAVEVGGNPDAIFRLEFKIMKRIMSINNLYELITEVLNVLNRIIYCTFANADIENRNLIFKAMNYIRKNYNNISLKDVASEVGLTPTYFSKLFKKETGKTYTEYLNLVRVEASKDWLKKDLSLAMICKKVGFKNQSYFSRIFKEYEGVSPRNWKQSSFLKNGKRGLGM